MRRSHLKRGVVLPRRAPLKPGRRKPRPSSSAAAWRDGVPTGYDAHHAIHAQHVRAAGGDVYDTRNRLVLTRERHAAHHAGDQIHICCVPTSAFEFAGELLGPGRAYEYLRRHYRGTDDRLLALLDQEPMAA